MEIPKNVQDKLKCSKCDELLSCGPVYLLHGTGGTICGRCSQQSEDSTKSENSNRIRNVPYEITASLLAFPCAFAAGGCPEKLTFTLGHPPHESSCKLWPFVCPVAPRGTCEWIGSWPNLTEHCSEKHASNILENPGNLPRPHLIASNVQTYIISAFRCLFLLHVKVCVFSGNLYHSLQMFGDSKFLDKFSYSLEIKGNYLKLTTYGSVLPLEIMTLQEATANSISINNLLGIFRDIGNDMGLKFCEECEGKLVKCRFNDNNCSFVDFTENKCWKHEDYFCKYQTNCHWCGEDFMRGSFFEHVVSLNCFDKSVEPNIDSVVRVTEKTNYYDICTVFSSNNIGTVLCDYSLFMSNLKLKLYTSLPSYELKDFKCSIKLTDPQTKHTQILTPELNNYRRRDWSIDVNMNNFPSRKNIGIDLKINIDKNVA